MGTLNIYTEPWAYVFVDGKAAGSTPIMGLKVVEGTHRVRFERPSGRGSETVVHVAPGQTQVVTVDLDAKGP